MRLISVYACTLFLILCKTAFSSSISRVVIPTANILRQRLNSRGFPHFIEKAELIRALAGREQHPLNIALAVDLACGSYRRTMTLDMNPEGIREIDKKMIDLEPCVLEALLQDNPKILKELKRCSAKLNRVLS